MIEKIKFFNNLHENANSKSVLRIHSNFFFNTIITIFNVKDKKIINLEYIIANSRALKVLFK